MLLLPAADAVVSPEVPLENPVGKAVDRRLGVLVRRRRIPLKCKSEIIMRQMTRLYSKFCTALKRRKYVTGWTARTAGGEEQVKRVTDIPIFQQHSGSELPLGQENPRKSHRNKIMSSHGGNEPDPDAHGCQRLRVPRQLPRGILYPLP